LVQGLAAIRAPLTFLSFSQTASNSLLPLLEPPTAVMQAQRSFNLQLPAGAPKIIRDIATKIYQGAVLKTTRSTYKTAVYGPNGYVTVLRLFRVQDQDMWPATPELVSTWVAWLEAQSLSCAKSYITGLRDAHVDADIPWMSGQQQLARLSKIRSGASKITNLRPKKLNSKCFPITPLHVRVFAECSAIREAPDGPTFLAISAIASYRGNRGGELLIPPDASPDGDGDCSLRMCHLQLNDEARSAILTLPRDKTHQSSTVDIWLPELEDDATCPLGLICDMIDQRKERNGGVMPSPKSFLFETVEGVQVTLPILRQWTFDALHHFGLFVPEGLSIGMKAWRRGHVSAAENVPPDLRVAVKKTGRWKSNAVHTYAHRGLFLEILVLAKDSRDRLASLPPGKHLRYLLNPDQEVFMQFPKRVTEPLLPPPLMPSKEAFRRFIARNPTTGVLPGVTVLHYGKPKPKRRRAMSPPRSDASSVSRGPGPPLKKRRGRFDRVRLVNL
jgi:hypothetical protein